MFLPVAPGAANQWALWDYTTRTVRTPAAGTDGLMLADLGQVEQGYLWLVDRVVVQSTSAADTVAFLYLDQVADRLCLDGTRVGNFDVADQSAPILVPGGSSLLCQWKGATAGAVGTIRAQITVLKAAR